ncbi:MAG: glycosyltransferase family 4 protein [Deltaproteobacteria bacterium]|nr:glycosyltransferase family 4 protein [Deltaproteobacteria bacterium]
MLKIGLITYPMETNPAGIGLHVEKLIENIIDLDRENRYYLLHFTPNDNPVYRNKEVLYTYYRHLPVMFSDSWYLYNHSDRFDIVHRFSPGGFLFRIPCRIVVTVHDLFLYKRYPFNKSLSLYLARPFNRISLKRADALLAVSQYTRQEIVKTFGLDERRIRVIHNGVDMVADKSENARRVLEREYNIKGGYILFVSTIEPRKNLISLVKAYEVLKEKYFIEESLVVVGKRGWGCKKTFNYIERSKFRNSITFTGFVPKHHLPFFYTHANLFVYPSLMEGFGIPPLEAMQCGCPTLTSNTSSLPEVVQHPEMMFDPEDMDQIVERVIRILRDPVFRQDNMRKGMENAKRFSWRKSAQQIISIYQTLGSDRRTSRF